MRRAPQPGDKIERTPRGHDVQLLREMLDLAPDERIRRNAGWVRMVEKLRKATRKADGSGHDLQDPE